MTLCPSCRSLLLLLEPALAALFLSGYSSCTGSRCSIFEHEPISTFRVPGPRRTSRIWAICIGDRATDCAASQDPEGEEWKFMDKHGAVVFDDLPPPTSEGLASQDGERPLPRRPSLPELDCGQLRQLPRHGPLGTQSRIRTFLRRRHRKSHSHSRVRRLQICCRPQAGIACTADLYERDIRRDPAYIGRR
jgi:hypothetical protein